MVQSGVRGSHRRDDRATPPAPSGLGLQERSAARDRHVCGDVDQSFEWLHAVLFERMKPDARGQIYPTKVSTTATDTKVQWTSRIVASILSHAV